MGSYICTSYVAPCDDDLFCTKYKLALQRANLSMTVSLSEQYQTQVQKFVSRTAISKVEMTWLLSRVVGISMGYL